MSGANAPQASTAYEEAVEYVTSLIRAEPTPGAERERLALAPIRALLGALGNPERALACVHIAGSKGKGSTALLTERALLAGGLVTGTYTSPHLAEWTERIRIGGQPVSRRVFAEAVLAARDARREVRDAPPPSFFDVLTAAALLAFARAELDVVILETGLGGRLDATNVIARPRATCITTIELEHADKLGDTLAAIAAEKAGIIKPGVPLAIGRLQAEPRAVIEARAAALGASVWSLAERAAIVAGTRGGWRVALELDTGTLSFDVDHPSPVMAEDAALAAACVALSGCVDAGRFDAAAAALASARVPGRLDVLGTSPLRIVDGAHTTESVRWLIEMLDALGAPRLDLVVSVTRGKDPRALLAPLIERAARVYVTSAEPSRSIGAAELAAAIAGLPGANQVFVLTDPREALLAAERSTPRDGALCATGSLYLAGAALRTLDAPRRR